MMHRVRVSLRLHRHGTTPRVVARCVAIIGTVALALFPCNPTGGVCSIQKVARIHLHRRLVGGHTDRDARDGRVDPNNALLHNPRCPSRKHPRIVVTTLGCRGSFVDVGANGFPGRKVQVGVGCLGHVEEGARGDEDVIHCDDTMGCGHGEHVPFYRGRTIDIGIKVEVCLTLDVCVCVCVCGG